MALIGIYGLLGAPARFRKSSAIYFFVVFPIVSFWLLRGGLGLMPVPTEQWGGFMLTIVISIVGIVLSLPIGIVLALGRRSQLPVIHLLCVIFIELVRAVPLITVLFMANILLPLFLPPGLQVNVLLRVLVGITAFASAYMAEVIRGGLQAIPKGQYEGAMAMGLGYGQMMRLIVLPQALTVAIPGIVNTFIGFFMDTTLVSMVGLFDFLNMVKAGFKDPNWVGVEITGYTFCAIVFWIICFSMSRYSMYLERKLHTGHKKR
jgi:general L-amino acid transport system permease protein